MRTGSFFRRVKLLLWLLALLLEAVNASPFNGVQTRKLKNGINVVLDPLLHSSLTAIAVCVRSGSSDEPTDARGVAHLVEHLVIMQAKKIGRLESLGAVTNAETAFDYTAFYCVVRSNLVYEAVKAMCEMFAPTLERSSIDVEKKIIKLELMQRDEDPIKLVRFLSQGLLLGFNPIDDDPKQLSYEQALHFYRTNYVPSKMSVICSGSFDEHILLKALQATFGELKGDGSELTVPQQRSHEFLKPLVLEVDKPFHAMSMAFKAPGASEPKALVTTELIATHLGDSHIGILAKLTNQPQSDRLPILSFEVSFVPRRHESVLSLNFLLTEGKFAEVEKEMIEQLNNMRSSPLSEERLLQCKRLSELHFRTRCKTVLERARTLAEAEGIANCELAIHYLKLIDEVSTNDVMQLSKRIFNAHSYTIAVVKPSTTQRTDDVGG
jgi:predicted Zn-dependent peptidase